jgi:hypothetical protein
MLTIAQLDNAFNVLNSMYFENALPNVTIKYCNSKCYMGLFCPRKDKFNRCTIKINKYYDITDIDASFKLEEFSENDYASVMALMAANRGKDSEPKVGLFWYNRANNSLFGVVSYRLSDYSQANASDGRITCSEMHEDVWKKEFRKQKYQNNGVGPFVGAYQDKPRGRVFYNINTDTFEVAVGKWLNDFPQAYQLVLEEFNLPPEQTKPFYAVHWDIGMSWR